MAIAQAARAKYKAQKTVVDGIRFDSKSEAEYYLHLTELKKNGTILDFELQPRYVLQEAFQKNGKKYRPIEYVADFLVILPDETVEVIDVKGMETPDFKIKKKLFEKLHPHLELKLMKNVKKYGGWITIDDWKSKKKSEVK